MDPLIIVLLVVGALVVAGIAFTALRKRQGERLHQRFGSEYDHQVQEAGGSRAKAEAELLKREKRHKKLDIKPLPPQQREAFRENWKEVQARFVDDPERSVALADGLVAEVMNARGYPVENFEQRAADISVDNPRIVENYRAAHTIAMRHGEGKADTEDLRAAMIGYRKLFEELLGADERELAH